RDDLEKAMAITDRLVKSDQQNPKVKSERSIEYQNLAMLYDARGDRARALDAYRKNLELKEDILRTTPDYHGIQRGDAMATAQLGEALAKVGRRKEALKAFDKSIAGFLEAVKSGAPPDVAREAAVARIKKSDVQLMEDDFSGAAESLRAASQTILPMAKSDPENAMLSSDLIGLEYQRGVILILQKKYDMAVETLQAALKKYPTSGATAEVPPGKGAMQLWLGEAEMGRRNFEAALQYFQAATTELSASNSEPLHDDFRCQLAISQSKSGRAFLMLGKT